VHSLHVEGATRVRMPHCELKWEILVEINYNQGGTSNVKSKGYAPVGKGN